MGARETLNCAIAAFALIGTNSVAAETASPPQRMITLEVYGSDPCPVGEGDEIVVCARKPESERYRIPKPLREDTDRRPAEISWGARVADLEEANRPSMPGSCSVVGSGGQTGCFQQMLRQWFAERRMNGSR
jgi:hypothetical protein